MLLNYFLFLNLIFAQSPMKVVTTLPDMAEVVRSIGGNQVQVINLLSGTENAHYVDALPSFIKAVSKADIVCVSGLDLEVGWMPKVLSRSGNAKVQSGSKGYCDMGTGVQVVDKPSGPIDRSMGDVHPSGNPHYNLSPKALSQAGRVALDILIQHRPDQKQVFENNFRQFEKNMTALQNKIATMFHHIRSQNKPLFIEYHKELAYFFDVYGLKSFGSIEEKPGVPPSARRLAEVSLAAKAVGVRLGIGAHYHPDSHLQKFSDLSDIPYIKVPMMVQKNFDSIEKLHTEIANQILKVLESKK